jgi:hypothetical protein
MPKKKDLKRLVRTRMGETGENYTQALAHVLSQVDLEPLPPAWHVTGTRASDYEAGLLPEITHDGNRVARLRLRPGLSKPGLAEPANSEAAGFGTLMPGFGTLMQSITATRYLDRRVRFSALLRAWEVTDWAGLWLRVDGPSGILRLDNMQDRPLRQTTDWTEASTVLDVAPQAMELHFGALLSGPGAVDLARPRFEEVGEDVPLTIGRLPDEPQALDFGQES